MLLLLAAPYAGVVGLAAGPFVGPWRRRGFSRLLEGTAHLVVRKRTREQNLRAIRRPTRTTGACFDFCQRLGLAAGERQHVDLRLLLVRAADERQAIAGRRPHGRGVARCTEGELARRRLAIG